MFLGFEGKAMGLVNKRKKLCHYGISLKFIPNCFRSYIQGNFGVW